MRADISVTGGSLQPAAGKGAVKVITSGDNTTRFDPDKKTLDTMKSNTTVKVAKGCSCCGNGQRRKTTYYNTVEEALGSNTEDGNIHIYINEKLFCKTGSFGRRKRNIDSCSRSRFGSDIRN